VILEAIPAPYFGTNCWILAREVGSECFIVDPGIASPNFLPQIKEVLTTFNLKPVATVITHGHLDHTFSVLPLCQGYSIPAYIHSNDRALLHDPFRALQPGGPSSQIMQELGVTHFSEPDDVRELVDHQEISLVGFDVTVHHAPGHTAGSAIFQFDEHLLSGDVLFAGSIGRTDMPTGSPEAMVRTLKEKILPLPDEVIVLPGHGPQTTIGRERKNNPYLQGDFLFQK
jgi:hydroxyacylglutathione hydrolase